MEKVLYFEQIERNKRYSWVLVTLVFATLGLMSIVFSLIFAKLYGAGVMFLFLMFSTIFNIGYILYTYYKSADIAVSAVHAYPADERKHRVYIDVVEEMAIAGGVPKPRTYLMPSPDINAFAAGRDPSHSVVCVTEGCLAKLNRQELTSVIGHEMTHIRNFDIRLVTLIAVMVGLVSIMSQLFLRSMWYGGGSGGRDRRDGGGGLLIVLLLAGIILSIIAPLIVKLVQLAISRKREFMADAGSVELTRYPDGLISALKKIRESSQGGLQTKVNEAVAPMFFSDPTKNRFMDVFDTHPPIEDRIKALEKM
jgi:heat shock protein HtpX